MNKIMILNGHFVVVYSFCVTGEDERRIYSTTNPLCLSMRERFSLCFSLSGNSFSSLLCAVETLEPMFHLMILVIDACGKIRELGCWM
jgi:hypothetical protein